MKREKQQEQQEECVVEARKTTTYRCWCRQWISKRLSFWPPSAGLCVSPANGRVSRRGVERVRSRGESHSISVWNTTLAAAAEAVENFCQFYSPFSAWPANQSWPCHPARWSKVLAIPDSIPWWIAAPAAPVAYRMTGAHTMVRRV